MQENASAGQRGWLSSKGPSSPTLSMILCSFPLQSSSAGLWKRKGRQGKLPQLCQGPKLPSALSGAESTWRGSPAPPRPPSLLQGAGEEPRRLRLLCQRSGAARAAILAQPRNYPECSGSCSLIH